MKQKILLINVNTCTAPYPVFPLGIAHLASALNRAGFEAVILDLAVDGADLGESVRRIRPDYIGLSLRNIDDVRIDNTIFYAPALKVAAERIRMVSDATLILGGSGYSLFPEELLRLTGADFGICGEGECSLVSLVQCLSAGQNPARIAGLVYHDGEQVKINPKTPCAPHNVTTPVLPHELVDFYLKRSTMLNVQTQRGCCYTCAYCSYPLIEGRRFRRRTPESVGDDIEAAVRAGARYLFVVDSVFNTSEGHVRGVCEEILRRDIDIQWGCFLRPTGLTQPLMDLMARAGLTHIEFGTDSLCDSVLESYGKGFTFDDVYQASEYARAARVHYAHFLIIGGPGETEDTVREGFANSRRLKRTAFFPYIGVRLFPGTPLYSVALAEGLIDRNRPLLEPYFYVTPSVSRERLAAMLADFSGKSLNWIIQDLSEKNREVVEGLRRIGVVGPLWEFLIR